MDSTMMKNIVLVMFFLLGALGLMTIVSGRFTTQFDFFASMAMVMEALGSNIGALGRI
jgi:hypothetical protein